MLLSQKKYERVCNEYNFIRKYTYWNGIGRKNHPINEKLDKSKFRRKQNLRESLNRALFVLALHFIQKQGKPRLNYISDGTPAQSDVT